jgi:hypothetical protein
MTGKRGHKQCTHCEGYTGPRSLSCPHCGVEFESRAKEQRDPNKPDGRGRKICPDCTQPNGVRARFCKSCNFAFTIKKRVGPMRGQITEWEDLAKRTKVKVIGGSGPYYETPDGERHYSVARGVYHVLSVEKTGLNVNSDKYGRRFLYMGPKIKSRIATNLWEDACKIVRVK